MASKKEWNPESKLCDLKKLVKEQTGAYIRLVNNPGFLCLKCGRVGRKENNLCKAVELPSQADRVPQRPS
jgi:hypothetical protein